MEEEIKKDDVQVNKEISKEELKPTIDKTAKKEDNI